MSRQEGSCYGDLGRTARNRISEITGIQVQNLIRKLDVLLPILLPKPLELQEILHEGDFTTGEYNPKTGSTGKHVLQEVSILGHLRRINALQDHDHQQQKGEELEPARPCPNTVAFELGAGTGKLSDRLQKVTNARMHHILIDRQNFQPQKCRIRHMIARRNKIHAAEVDKVSENLSNDTIEQQSEGRRKRTRLTSIDHDGSKRFPLVRRVVADLASLKLEEYVNCCPPSTPDESVIEYQEAITDVNQGIGDGSTLSRKEKLLPLNQHQQQLCSCICLSKHLCGPACDLSIGAINRIDTNLTFRPDCVIVATCCHYLCTWDSFTSASQKFWTTCRLNQDDFEVAVTVSQWASLKSNKKMKPSSVPSSAASLCAGSAEDFSNTSPFPNLLDLARKAGESLRSSTSSSSEEESPSSLVPSEEFERSFSKESKIALGIQAKQLLDLARIAALQQHGKYDVELVRFTTRSVEDRLLIAYKRRVGI